MMILHAAQTEMGFLLWGESSPASSTSSAPSSSAASAAAAADEDTAPALPPKRAAQRKAVSPAPSPFDAGQAALDTVLAEHLGLSPGVASPLEAIAWLPSSRSGPVPSSRLLHDVEKAEASLRLRPWRVSAALLDAQEAVNALANCTGKQTLARGVFLGHDLAYWTEMLRFAGALVARQQYLPGVRIIGGHYHSVWEPVITAEEQSRFAAFAAAMPPSARALTKADGKAPPSTAAASVLRAFLTDMVDALVRSAMPQATAGKNGQARTSSTLRVPRAQPAVESAHDAWLAALRSPDGSIDWPKKDVTDLKNTLTRWKRPITVLSKSPVRLCFRLEEPTNGDALSDNVSSPSQPWSDSAWRVSYLLHPRDDHSLLLPIQDLWSGPKKRASVLKHLGTDAREYVLSALGQASGIAPEIEASLKDAAPQGYSLDVQGAHRFLTHTSLALEQAGFGVMLPSWWTNKGAKLRPVIQARVAAPKLRSSSGLSLDSIVEFDWQASLGGEPITHKELLALARLKVPLVQVRGQWVEVNAQEILAAADFWKKNNKNTAPARDILRMALGGEDAPHGFAFGGVQSAGWLSELLDQLEGRTACTELPPPAEFGGTLRPYQARGFAWLAFLQQWGLGACLADDMGLGKTIQTLALLQRLWSSGKKMPSLLICPTSVVNNWAREAEKFTPELPVMVHHGLDRKKGAAFRRLASAQALVISSYGLLQRDMAVLKDISWAGVILDEAQNIKNPETKQAKAARAIPAAYRIALTGTPVENNVGDLWSLMDFLNPGFLGSQQEFRKRFFMPIQTGRDPEAATRLKRLTAPFLLRRLKTDTSIISDLPDKVEMKEFCPLTKEQASLYAAVLEDLNRTLYEADGIQRKGIILATLSRLKQVCNHPAHFLGDNSAIDGRSGKLARLTEMLEEILPVGDKALVFTQFKEMGHILKAHLQDTLGREVLFLHGGVARKARDRMIERFQGDAQAPPIFILSLKAGSTGLNLTAANHVFHYDRWWNPAVENQATDRAFRIGQHRNVLVHKFVCSGTLEEKIDAMIERKKEISDAVVGVGEAWLTELSNQELRDLFALREKALEE